MYIYIYAKNIILLYIYTYTIDFLQGCKNSIYNNSCYKVVFVFKFFPGQIPCHVIHRKLHMTWLSELVIKCHRGDRQGVVDSHDQ
jgi:hypothetical protein